MENITFKQFIATYCFRSIDKNSRSGELSDFGDTQIIRIHLDTENSDDWFDFGIYNFGTTGYKLDNIDKIFSEEILKSYIDQISTKEYSVWSIVEIWLTSKKNTILD